MDRQMVSFQSVVQPAISGAGFVRRINGRGLDCLRCWFYSLGRAARHTEGFCHHNYSIDYDCVGFAWLGVTIGLALARRIAQ
jgi:hypothetical protein